MAQSLNTSLQRQLSIDLSTVSSPTDLITKLQLFNVDLVEFARENVGLFLMVFDLPLLLYSERSLAGYQRPCQ